MQTDLIELRKLNLKLTGRKAIQFIQYYLKTGQELAVVGSIKSKVNMALKTRLVKSFRYLPTLHKLGTAPPLSLQKPEAYALD